MNGCDVLLVKLKVALWAFGKYHFGSPVSRRWLRCFSIRVVPHVCELQAWWIFGFEPIVVTSLLVTCYWGQKGSFAQAVCRLTDFRLC